jgi:hypothetical protein
MTSEESAGMEDAEAEQRRAEYAEEMALRAEGIPTELSSVDAAEQRAEWQMDTELCGREPEAG